MKIIKLGVLGLTRILTASRLLADERGNRVDY